MVEVTDGLTMRTMKTNALFYIECTTVISWWCSAADWWFVKVSMCAGHKQCYYNATLQD